MSAIAIYLISALSVAMCESINDIGINENEYQPGFGLCVGKVVNFSGKVVLIHLKETSGYSVFQGMNIYRGDTMITGEASKVTIRFNDGSQLFQDELSRTQCILIDYSPNKRIKNAFIQISSGAFQFFVQQLDSHMNCRFRIKTLTALIYVQDSKFIVQAQPDFTEVITLDSTELAVINLAVPDFPPLRINPFEKATIVSRKSLLSPIPLTKKEIESIKMEFQFETQPKMTTDRQETNSVSDHKHPMRVYNSDTSIITIQQVLFETEYFPFYDFSDVINTIESKIDDDINYIMEK